MKRKILFFVVAFLFIGCSQERIQKSEEDFESQIYGLVAGLQHQADNLGVKFGAEKASNLREALLDPSTTRGQADALLIQAQAGITEEYQRRLKKVIEEAIEFHTPYVEEALDWRFTELKKLIDDPQVNSSIRAKAHDMYYWLAANEVSLLQSFKDRLWEEMDGMKVPVNGELVACWEACGRGYEARYRNCNVTDNACWDAALAWYIACICSCPDPLEGAHRMPEEDQGHPWGEQK